MGAESAPRPALGEAAAGSSVGTSERMLLARLVREAALRVPGVVTTTSGVGQPVMTMDGSARIDGVMCVAASDGYDVAVRLVCEMVPLPALGEQVEAAARRTAEQARIPVASVSVHIAELIDGRH